MNTTRPLRVVAVIIAGAGALAPAAPSHAIASRSYASVTAPVNTNECPDKPPVLVNGSFEKFSDPDKNPDVTSALEARNGQIYGKWHGYAQGPNQILFLKPTASPGVGEDANYVTGWKSTSTMIEIQRQVDSYTEAINDAGKTAYQGEALSGIATASNSLQSGHWDRYAPQPADGDHWAELNAHSPSALYQDITVPSSAQLFWSVKHRGRTNSNEEMRVLIGPVTGATAKLAAQTSIMKFAPTNADKFSGEPTYGTSTRVSRMVGNLREGWEMYQGSYPADADASGTDERVVRFQFEAIRGSNGWATVGNLLDDIRFVPFMACPVTRIMHLGETERLDVTGKVSPNSGERVSYGLGLELGAISNPTAPAGEFATSGNVVSFTPTKVGTFTVNYHVSMEFADKTYTAVSRITYEVYPGPVVIFDARGGTVDVETVVLNKNAPLSSVTLPTPVRKGFEFIGWYTKRDGGTEVTPEYAATTVPTDEITLYARWSEIEETSSLGEPEAGSSIEGASEPAGLPATGFPAVTLLSASLGLVLLGVRARRRHVVG